MAEKESIADNPFSALFPSLDHAQLYMANKQLAQHQSGKCKDIPFSVQFYDVSC